MCRGHSEFILAGIASRRRRWSVEKRIGPCDLAVDNGRLPDDECCFCEAEPGLDRRIERIVGSAQPPQRSGVTPQSRLALLRASHPGRSRGGSASLDPVKGYLDIVLTLGALAERRREQLQRLADLLISGHAYTIASRPFLQAPCTRLYSSSEPRASSLAAARQPARAA